VWHTTHTVLHQRKVEVWHGVKVQPCRPCEPRWHQLWLYVRSRVACNLATEQGTALVVGEQNGMELLGEGSAGDPHQKALFVSGRWNVDSRTVSQVSCGAPHASPAYVFFLQWSTKQRAQEKREPSAWNLDSADVLIVPQMNL